ncbi:MAG: phage head morphogenesis protein [Rhodospirillaceae bacterium]|nr:MAG: phage head morphogenesis protein [Rhodospirillaceae bacterium]
MIYSGLAFDRARTGISRSPFIRARKVEIQFVKQLRKIAAHVGDIARGFDLEDPMALAALQGALERYSSILDPWAEAVSARMIAEADARDVKAWNRLSTVIGRQLHREIRDAPTGNRMRQLLGEQVKLITSLPLEASERVHKLTLEGIQEGRRAAEIAKELARTGEVTESRAMLIARTEVGRTSTVLTQARAEYIGSTHFIWRTAGDSDVRPSHRRLNGKSFRWDDPPECDPGYHALPGAIFNCRCYPEPIIPEQ